MDFTHDPEQIALRDAVRSLLKGYDAEHRRQSVKGDPGFDPETWSQLAEMGVLGLPFAEADGGMGAGPVEVSLAAEELGRVLAPEPFVQCVVLAGGLIAAGAPDGLRQELLGALSAGELLPAAAWSSAGELSAEGETVSGVAEPVLAGGTADVVVVRAGRELFLVDLRGADAESVQRTSYATFDGTRAARIVFDRTPATRLEAAPEALERVVAATQIAYCHEALGAMDTALNATTSYLTTRKQFGVTLNRFQALTFRAADMYTSLELTRSIVSWATMVLAEDGIEVAKVRDAGSRAKLQVSRASRHIGQEAIQLHGGIAMTDEYSVGHYTARLTAIDHLLGDGAAQVRRLSPGLGEYGVIDPLST